MIDSKNFTGPVPPEWRTNASVAYFKDKLHYLGGYDTSKDERTNHVNVTKPNDKSIK